MSDGSVKFCSNCGQAVESGATHCSRCGAVLGIGAADPKPKGMPGWAIALIACLVVSPFVVVVLGILAAIAIPNFLTFQARAKSASAAANLREIWAAEQRWAASHDGEFLPFTASRTAADENWGSLGLPAEVRKGMHHQYEGWYEGDLFVVAAWGNVDGDAATDEWEISEENPTPVHTKDDVAIGSGGAIGGPVGIVEEASGGGGGEPGGATEESLSTLFTKSQTAAQNLQAIWEREQVYFATHRSYLGFSEGTAEVWAQLGVQLPAEANHVYVGASTGQGLTLRADGNLDSDPFRDVWVLSSADGQIRQLQNDAFDVSSGGDAAEDRE